MSEFHHFQARSLRGEPVELSRYAGQVAQGYRTRKS
jgi:glutathione peroxidase